MTRPKQNPPKKPPYRYRLLLGNVTVAVLAIR